MIHQVQKNSDVDKYIFLQYISIPNSNHASILELPQGYCVVLCSSTFFVTVFWSFVIVSSFYSPFFQHL